MFVTNNDALFEKVLTLSNHGRSAGQLKQFWPDMIDLNISCLMSRRQSGWPRWSVSKIWLPTNDEFLRPTARCWKVCQ